MREGVILGFLKELLTVDLLNKLQVKELMRFKLKFQFSEFRFFMLECISNMPNFKYQTEEMESIVSYI